MSCNCLKIYLEVIPDNIPDHFKEANGSVMLDLYEDQTFLKTKKNEQLTDFDKISGGAVLGIVVPPTDKNNLIFCGYKDAGAYDFNHKARIPVIIFENGLSLDQDALVVIEESKKGWELDVVKSSAFWKEALADTRLSEIDWGCFTLTEANVYNQWNNERTYNDGDPGYFWTVAHFKNWHQLKATYDADGNLLTQGEAGVEDTRPFLFALAILQKGFCLKGWKFRSPILESAWGRQLLTYVLEDFGGGGDLSGYGFRASVVADYSDTKTAATANTAIELHSRDEATPPNYDACDFHIYDVVGINVPLYGPTIYHYATGFSGIVQINYCVSLSTATATGLTFRAVVRDTTTGCVVPACPLDLNQDNLPVTSTPIQYCGTLQVVSLNPVDIITFTVEYANPAAVPTIHAGSYWEANHSSVFLTEDSVIPVNQIVSSEYLFLDFFKGILHILGQGKILTDFIKKEVWVFHESEVQLFDSSEPEAFYKSINDPEVITDKVICKSRVTKLNTRNLERYYRLCFKDSSDAYVESLNYNNDNNPLWGRLLDFGEEFLNNKVKKSCNPFFEPTAQILAEDVDYNDGPFELPALWDDDDDRSNIAYDIGPRILYLHPDLGNQLLSDDGVGGYTYRDFFFQTGVQTAIPNLFQFTEQAIGVGAAAIAPQENIVYSTPLAMNTLNDAKDMYTLFWRLKLLEVYKAFSAFYDVLIDNCFYKTIDFRKYIQFLYEGQFLTFKLLQIRSFKPCLPTPSKFELRPIVIPVDCIESDCINCYTIDETGIEWQDPDSLSIVLNIQGETTLFEPPQVTSNICTFNGFAMVDGWLAALWPDATIECNVQFINLTGVTDVYLKICNPPEPLVSITVCVGGGSCVSSPPNFTYFFTASTECSDTP